LRQKADRQVAGLQIAPEVPVAIGGAEVTVALILREIAASREAVVISLATPAAVAAVNVMAVNAADVGEARNRRQTGSSGRVADGTCEKARGGSVGRLNNVMPSSAQGWAIFSFSHQHRID
jgi:hypothetical protein